MSRIPMIGPMVKKMAGHRRIGSSFHSLKYRLRIWLSPQPAWSPRHPDIMPPDDTFKQMSFTFAVIALSARIACVDELSRGKYITFRESFPLSGHLCGKIRSLFMLACDNTTPLEYYISQIRTMFPARPALYVSLVERLAAIASADGAVSRAAERLLTAIAHGLELSPAQYALILARHDSEASQAQKLLGVSNRTGVNALKKRYRELIRRYHPDRFAASDMSPEIELLLHLKSSEINEAYRLLRGRAA